MTEATMRLHKWPEQSDYRGYLFRDFASGIAAIREAAQDEIPIAMLRLSDADETRFYRAFGNAGKARAFYRPVGRCLSRRTQIRQARPAR